MELIKMNKKKVVDDLEKVENDIKELVDSFEKINECVDNFEFYFYDEKESFNKEYDNVLHNIKYDKYFMETGKNKIKNNEKDWNLKWFVKECLVKFNYTNKIINWWNKNGWEQFYNRFDSLNNEQKVEANENMFIFKSLVNDFYRVSDNLDKSFSELIEKDFKIDCKKFNECVKENKTLNVEKIAKNFVDGGDVDKRIEKENNFYKKVDLEK